MLVEHSNRRTFPIDRHAGAAIAGVAADGRAVVNRAREEASKYKSFYGDPIPGKVLAERLASHVHLFNLYWYVRPYGAAAILATYDSDGPAMYVVEPSGMMHRFNGAAVGKGRQGARNEIEKLKLGELTCREGIQAAAKILHQVHDEEKGFELELAWICDESERLFQRVPQDLAEEAERLAKEAIEAEDMDD